MRVTALADAPGSGTTERGEVSSDPFTRPAVGRGTALTLGPLAEPEEVSGRLRAESPIEPWFARRATPAESEETDAEDDCPADRRAPPDPVPATVGADRSGEDRHAISGDEVSP